MRLNWTRTALRNLRAAQQYIAADNPKAAQRQVALIRSAVQNLIRFPELGRLGRHAGTRELVVPRTPFIVAYKLRGEVIEILAVIHAKQQWPDEF